MVNNDLKVLNFECFIYTRTAAAAAAILLAYVYVDRLLSTKL